MIFMTFWLYYYLFTLMKPPTLTVTEKSIIKLFAKYCVSDCVWAFDLSSYFRSSIITQCQCCLARFRTASGKVVECIIYQRFKTKKKQRKKKNTDDSLVNASVPELNRTSKWQPNKPMFERGGKKRILCYRVSCACAQSRRGRVTAGCVYMLSEVGLYRIPQRGWGG